MTTIGQWVGSMVTCTHHDEKRDSAAESQLWILYRKSHNNHVSLSSSSLHGHAYGRLLREQLPSLYRMISRRAPPGP